LKIYFLFTKLYFQLGSPVLNSYLHPCSRTTTSSKHSLYCNRTSGFKLKTQDQI